MIGRKDIQLMTAVTEEGNLTRASARLRLTPSALSHRLRKLERRVGTPLFRRMGRRMIPTPAGERLAEGSRRALKALHEAEEEVRRMAGGDPPVLRIATECYTCYHWLPAVIQALREDAVDVEVRVVARATRRPIPMLLDGRLDLAVVSRPPADPRLLELPLFEDDLVLVVPPSHALAARPWIEPADLADQHLLMYDMPDGESVVLQDFLSPAGVRPRRVSKLPLTEAVLELVKADLGVAALARWAVEPWIAAGEVVPVALGEGRLVRQWRAVITTYRSVPDHVGDFARLLSERIRPPGVAERSAPGRVPRQPTGPTGRVATNGGAGHLTGP